MKDGTYLQISIYKINKNATILFEILKDKRSIYIGYRDIENI